MPNQKNVLTTITNYLKQNNGDPKAAYYAIAKDYGVDPNPIANEIQAVKDPINYAENIIKSNPEIADMLNLLASIK